MAGVLTRTMSSESPVRHRRTSCFRNCSQSLGGSFATNRGRRRREASRCVPLALLWACGRAIARGYPSRHLSRRSAGGPRYEKSRPSGLNALMSTSGHQARTEISEVAPELRRRGLATWEQSAAYHLDKHPRVLRLVKNQGSRLHDSIPTRGRSGMTTSRTLSLDSITAST